MLIGTLLFGRVIGAVERARCRWLLDTAVASPFHPLGGTGSLWDRFKAIIADGAAWKALAFGLVSLPFGILTFVVTVVLWSVGLTGVTFPLYGWALSQGEGGLQLGLAERVLVSVVYGLLGLGVLVATPYIVRAMAAVNRLLVTGLLGPSGSAELQRRVEELSGSRDASVDAAEAERRRIERDLHDGAQQRLVALAMDLGLAKDRLERARTSRRDRGSWSARPTTRPSGPSPSYGSWCAASTPPYWPTGAWTPPCPPSPPAARCPVNLEVDLPGRLPAPIETTAYFVVAEALTNVAKHSRAQRARRCGSPRTAPLVRRGHRRRRRRRRASTRRRAWPAWSTGSGPSRARCDWPARRAGRRRCWWSSVRVVIAEDSVLLREGLGRLLAESGDEVVAALGDAEALVAAVEEHQPGCRHRRRAHAADAHRRGAARRDRLRRDAGPDSPVLVLSQYVEERYASDLLSDDTEAVGYLLKERVADVADFVSALHRVAEGGTVLEGRPTFAEHDAARSSK